MEKTLVEIAEFLDGEIIGDRSIVIKGFSGLKEAGPGDLSFLANAKYSALLNETRAAAVLVSDQEKITTKTTVIQVKNPSAAFSRVVSLFTEHSFQSSQGVHPAAVVADTAVIGKNVSIGPCAVIEDRVRIGDNTVIGAGAFVGFQSQIGCNGLIYPNVTIRERAVIGDRVIIHSGAVVGSDGFGFITNEGVHEKIPQIGIVEIQDDVEIGANTTIDRARFEKTVIGRGTKIDNLVQIAHNVRIGEHCLIVSQVGISGSTEIKDHVVLGGQVGVVGHITIGSGAMVAAQSGVTASVEPGTLVLGSPAQPHMKAKRATAAISKLPEYLKIIRQLEMKIHELEKRMAEKS